MQRNEHRSGPRGLADLLLPYALVDDGILLQQDGSLVAGWAFQGPDMMAASVSEMSALSARLNQCLRLGNGWMIHCDVMRSQAPGYPHQGAFLDGVTRMIDDERREQFLQEGAHYESEYFLILTYLPPIEAEKLVLSAAEVSSMLGALEIRERLISRLAIFEGMRPSEILGLQRHDLDVDSVWVRRRIFKSNVDTPKTERSARRVALSLGTRDLLVGWLDNLASTTRDAWIFPATNLTTPVRRGNLWRRNFLPKLEPIGLEWATFQVMRRSFASLSKEAGVDAHTRSAHMGNSVDVNENEYAVSSFESRLAAVRKLESAVRL